MAHCGHAVMTDRWMRRGCTNVARVHQPVPERRHSLKIPTALFTKTIAKDQTQWSLQSDRLDVTVNVVLEKCLFPPPLLIFSTAVSTFKHKEIAQRYHHQNLQFSCSLHTPFRYISNRSQAGQGDTSP